MRSVSTNVMELFAVNPVLGCITVLFTCVAFDTRVYQTEMRNANPIECADAVNCGSILGLVLDFLPNSVSLLQFILFFYPLTRQELHH